MKTIAQLKALKSSAQVATAITNTAPSSTNSDVATNLSLKRWIVVSLRQIYHKTRI